MPLSDREQQILSEIESQLKSEDSKFAKALGGAQLSASRSRLRYAAVGLVVGLVLLLTIALNPWGPYLAFAGFVLMLVSAVTAGNALKHMGEDRARNLGGQLRGGFSRYLEGRHTEEE